MHYCVKTPKTVRFGYKISNKLPCWIWHIMQYYPSLIYSGIFTFVFYSQQKLICSCSVPSRLSIPKNGIRRRPIYQNA